MRLRHTSQIARTLTPIILIVSAMTEPAIGDRLPYRHDWTMGRSVDRSAGESIESGADGPVLGGQYDEWSEPTEGPGQKTNRGLGWQAATNQDDPNEFNVLHSMDGATLGGDQSWDGGNGRIGLDFGNGMFDSLALLIQPDMESDERHVRSDGLLPITVRPGNLIDVPVPALIHESDMPVPAPGSTTVIGLMAAGLLCSRSRRVKR